MKLKTLATASAAMLVSISLLTASGLMLGTSYMNREGARLFHLVREVRSTTELEVNLLLHERESARAALTRSPEHARARDAARREIERWLADLRDNPATAENAAHFEAAERRIADYFTAHARADGQASSPAAAYTATHAEVDAAYAALERLLATKLAEAQRARARVNEVNRRSDVMSLGAASMLLVGVGVALWQAGKRVYCPLLALRTAIDRYGAGSRDARAVQDGLDELREIAVAFNEMAAALAEQRQKQLGILASVAHDLRNPLAALKLTVDRLRPDRPLPPEERLRAMLARVGQEVARCDRMLTDLMDFARLEGEELELRYEVRDARELAREVVELYRPTATAHELNLSLPEEPVPLRCDPLRIERVLNNLVANAIKYSPGGGAVLVSVTCADAEIAIAVSDGGVGIAAEDQGRLFQRYGRAPSSSGVAPGAGLGLWAARHIAEAHGGRIDVASAPGSGSTFTLRLPSTPPSAS
ncbi:histidine kinase [Sorangium cellulosum]|uniref:histidine kinase n=1 Tax=Sorangium cellulosum TaxID=56 RepID=A0A2L0ELT3_SORCE|nr:HAMP domain-containing sensor histidine kinase [Sorangium cellulosum]AUX40258.1 histidine kinase [Sorangium cellulosum]